MIAKSTDAIINRDLSFEKPLILIYERTLNQPTLKKQFFQQR